MSPVGGLTQLLRLVTEVRFTPYSMSVLAGILSAKLYRRLLDLRGVGRIGSGRALALHFRGPCF